MHLQHQAANSWCRFLLYKKFLHCDRVRTFWYHKIKMVRSQSVKWKFHGMFSTKSVKYVELIDSVYHAQKNSSPTMCFAKCAVFVTAPLTYCALCSGEDCCNTGNKGELTCFSSLLFSFAFPCSPMLKWSSAEHQGGNTLNKTYCWCGEQPHPQGLLSYWDGDEKAMGTRLCGESKFFVSFCACV